MKPARDWIALHGQSGEYPKVDEPIGCFTEAQIRQIQMDAMSATPDQRDALWEKARLDFFNVKEEK